MAQINPIMATKRAAKALDDIEARDKEMLSQLNTLQTRVEGLEAQNREILTQLRNTQTQLADVSNTLKNVLPSLKTQQATRPTSKEESRQGS